MVDKKNNTDFFVTKFSVGSNFLQKLAVAKFSLSSRSDDDDDDDDKVLGLQGHVTVVWGHVVVSTVRRS